MEAQPEGNQPVEARLGVGQHPRQAQLPSSPQKLTGAQVKAKRKDFFKKLVSVLILIFMVGWVFAAYYGITSGSNKDNENLISVGGYNFYLLSDGTFGTYLNTGDSKIPVAFRLDPRNASAISLDSTAIQQILTAKKLYLTFDPNTGDNAKIIVAAIEISRITGLYKLDTVSAFTKDSDPPSPNVPIRTCDDVSSTTTVLELGINNMADTGIQNDKGCIKITGKNADELISAADKLGMNLIGIKL